MTLVFEIKENEELVAESTGVNIGGCIDIS